jgi:hypothetical protein
MNGSMLRVTMVQDALRLSHRRMQSGGPGKQVPRHARRIQVMHATLRVS